MLPLSAVNLTLQIETWQQAERCTSTWYWLSHMQTNRLFVICRVRNDGQVAPEVSTSVINSMFTAMRSGISAVSRRIGIPQALRKMLEGEGLDLNSGTLHQILPICMLARCCSAAEWLCKWCPCLAIMVCDVLIQSTPMH